MLQNTPTMCSIGSIFFFEICANNYLCWKCFFLSTIDSGCLSSLFLSCRCLFAAKLSNIQFKHIHNIIISKVEYYGTANNKKKRKKPYVNVICYVLFLCGSSGCDWHWSWIWPIAPNFIGVLLVDGYNWRNGTHLVEQEMANEGLIFKYQIMFTNWIYMGAKKRAEKSWDNIHLESRSRINVRIISRCKQQKKCIIVFTTMNLKKKKTIHFTLFV